MKKIHAIRLFTITAAVLISTFLFPCGKGSIAYAENSSETVLNITDFGANGTDQKDDFTAFNDAMHTAITANTDYVRMIIPAGTYYLSRPLAIFSNTIITADPNAVIISTGGYLGAMIYGAHVNDNGQECYGQSCTHGGYTQTQNVTIQGGTWDRGDTEGTDNSCVLSFRHSNNIRFENMVIKNSTNHQVDLAGSCNVTLDGCSIENSVENVTDDSRYWSSWKVGDKNRYDYIEAVHLDFCDPVGENSERAMPFDKTAVKNITVKNCNFSNVFACVGNHHAAPGDRPTNIIVENNTASNIRAYFFYAYDFDDFSVTNNIITDCGALCTLQNSNGTLENNQYSCNNRSDASDKDAIYIHDGGEVTVNNNTISGANAAGIHLNRDSDASCNKNTVTSTKTHGFLVSNGSSLTATGNSLSDIAGEAFGFTDKSSGEVTGNKIKKVTKHALYVNTECRLVFSGNEIDGISSEAVRVMKNSSLTAKNNTLKNIDRFGIYVSDSETEIAGNTIYDTGNSKQAIRTENCSKSVISGNTILSSSHAGIAVAGCNGAVISGNKISNTTGNGIHISLSKKVSAHNNTVKNAGSYGLLIEGTDDSNTASAYIFNNNLSSGVSYDIRIGKYAINCELANNTLAHNKASYDKTATYKIKARLFSDVLNGSIYYYKAVYWAADKGITNGYDDGSFGPELDCTRAHIVTFLWRLAGKPAPKKTTSPFTDVKAGTYYFKAVLWAAENGITKGYSDGTFGVDEPCTREQVMTFLWRMAGQPKPASQKNSFSDLTPGDYYYNAVLWAAEKGIANGYTSGEYAGKYGVGLTCLREHVVTFLYRFSNKVKI